MKTVKELSDLSGRWALITGAAGSLARVMADSLAELGANLILVDRPGTDFEPFKNSLNEKWKVKLITIECDLEDEGQRHIMINTVRSYGVGLNVLVNNAAFVDASDLPGWVDSFENQELDTWRRAMEVNLTAAFHLCQAFAPELRKGEGGNIVNIASIYGGYGPDWGLYEDTAMGNPAAYAVSKGGMIQMTRWLATTLAPDIRVNAISPGGIIRGQPEKFVKRYISKTPLGRMAKEGDFRGAVAFLATDMSRYVTGQNLYIDGGWGVW